MTYHIDNAAYKDIKKVLFEQLNKNLNKEEE